MSSRVFADEDCTSSWPFPLELDGWYLAHDALRADIKALEGMLAFFDRQLAGGKPITASQRRAASEYLRCFLKFLHHHHTNEDAIATPYLATRFTVPDKVGGDHKELEILVDRFEHDLRDLLAAQSLAEQVKLVQATSEALRPFQQLCLAHFEEEEEGIMPLMRRHFTPKQVAKNVVAKILRTMDGESAGMFFRPMTKEQRRAFARQEGIPFFIRWILFHQVAKYERNVWEPFARECLPPAASISA